MFHSFSSLEERAIDLTDIEKGHEEYYVIRRAIARHKREILKKHGLYKEKKKKEVKLQKYIYRAYYNKKFNIAEADPKKKSIGSYRKSSCVYFEYTDKLWKLAQEYNKKLDEADELYKKMKENAKKENI